MPQRVRLIVQDHSGNKLCDLQDSTLQIQGQAYDVQLARSRNGAKDLSFALPWYVDGKKNFRWDYIKPEYKVKWEKGDKEDWFIITEPAEDHTNDLTEDVDCIHVSLILRNKNIYLTFDDENGIGTCQDLLDKILVNTGWTRGYVDTMLEKDGVTEKIRSLTTTTAKDGAYQLITRLCDLFNAYPVFNGDAQTVDIYANQHRTGYTEINQGKNLKSIKRTRSSENLVTRLYVEGDQTQDAYVGIDEVNPTGLTQLLNFDYYREIGMFTQEHEEALDTYLANIQTVNSQIKTNSTQRENLTTQLNNLWGASQQVYWPVASGALGEAILFGGAEEEDISIKAKDVLYWGLTDSYEKETVLQDGVYTIPEGAAFAVKFVTKHGGTFGGKEVGIEAKEKMIAGFREDLETETDANRRAYLESQIAELEQGVTELQEGTAEAQGAQALFFEAVDKSLELNDLNIAYNQLSLQQLGIEAVFCTAMGEMLKDGYWSNTDYIAGQEQHLQDDSLEISKEMGFPEINYATTVLDLHAMGMDEAEIDLNYACRIYDPIAGINDQVQVNKMTEYPDKPEDNKIELSNKETDIGTQTFEALMSRITQITDMIIGRNSLYERAKAINQDGTIGAQILQGNIDVERQRLVSAVSNWQTDDNGNIIFTALDGSSAMMLAGEGFMIANGKTEDGEWNWRTFGTGRGFTADMIVTGFLSADRILAGSITAQKLAGDVGANIDLTNNATIQLLQDEISLKVSEEEVKALIKDSEIQVSDTNPEEPNVDSLWLDTGVDPNLLRRWTGSGTNPSRTYAASASGSSVSIDDAAPGSNIVVLPTANGSITHNGIYTSDAVAGESITFTAEKGTNTFTASAGSMSIAYVGTGWETVNDISALEQRISDAEVQITPEAIIGTVTSSVQQNYDLNSKADLNTLNQFIGEVEQSFTTMNTKISDVQLSAEDLTVTFTTLKESVESYEGDLRTVEEHLNANFRFSENGFQIWRNNSEFNIRIDNTEMGFYQGDQKVAYINNSKLYITSAQIENSMAIGAFSFVIEANNSLSISFSAQYIADKSSVLGVGVLGAMILGGD